MWRPVLFLLLNGPLSTLHRFVTDIAEGGIKN